MSRAPYGLAPSGKDLYRRLPAEGEELANVRDGAWSAFAEKALHICSSTRFDAFGHRQLGRRVAARGPARAPGSGRARVGKSGRAPAHRPDMVNRARRGPGRPRYPGRITLDEARLMSERGRRSTPDRNQPRRRSRRIRSPPATSVTTPPRRPGSISGTREVDGAGRLWAEAGRAPAAIRGSERTNAASRRWSDRIFHPPSEWWAQTSRASRMKSRIYLSASWAQVL